MGYLILDKLPVAFCPFMSQQSLVSITVNPVKLHFWIWSEIKLPSMLHKRIRDLLMSPRIVTLEAMISANAREFNGKKNFFFSLMFFDVSWSFSSRLKTLECSDSVGDCCNVACNLVVHDELVPHSSSCKALIARDQFMAWCLASREIEEINHITKVSRDLQGDVILKHHIGMIFTGCFWNYV